MADSDFTQLLAGVFDAINRLYPCVHTAADPDAPTCIHLEAERPLTEVEVGRGWKRRPFFAFFPKNMCGGCAAYWHAQRVGQLVGEIECGKRR